MVRAVERVRNTGQPLTGGQSQPARPPRGEVALAPAGRTPPCRQCGQRARAETARPIWREGQTFALEVGTALLFLGLNSKPREVRVDELRKLLPQIFRRHGYHSLFQAERDDSVYGREHQSSQ